jgi:hypothetical protein
LSKLITVAHGTGRRGEKNKWSCGWKSRPQDHRT